MQIFDIVIYICVLRLLKYIGPIDVIQGHLINFRYCDWWNVLRYSEM